MEPRLTPSGSRAGTARVLCVALLIASGCGGGGNSASLSSAGTQARGCPLSTDDVQRISGVTGLTRQDNAPTPAMQLTCSTAFNAPGELVLSATEATGGRQRLALVKKQNQGAGQETSVLAVPGLGDGAYLIDGRILAVRFGNRVVTLESGFTAGGAQVLTPSQMEALAKITAPST